MFLQDFYSVPYFHNSVRSAVIVGEMGVRLLSSLPVQVYLKANFGILSEGIVRVSVSPIAEKRTSAKSPDSKPPVKSSR